MTVKTRLREDRRGIAVGLQRKSARDAGSEALEKSVIAESSASAIDKMTCAESVRMIRVAKLSESLRPDLDEHLPFYDRTVLTRLAHLPQRCCRNHVDRFARKGN